MLASLRKFIIPISFRSCSVCSFVTTTLIIWRENQTADCKPTALTSLIGTEHVIDAKRGFISFNLAAVSETVNVDIGLPLALRKLICLYFQDKSGSRSSMISCALRLLCVTLVSTNAVHNASDFFSLIFRLWELSLSGSAGWYGSMPPNLGAGIPLNPSDNTSLSTPVTRSESMTWYLANFSADSAVAGRIQRYRLFVTDFLGHSNKLFLVDCLPSWTDLISFGWKKDDGFNLFLKGQPACPRSQSEGTVLSFGLEADIRDSSIS